MFALEKVKCGAFWATFFWHVLFLYKTNGWVWPWMVEIVYITSFDISGPPVLSNLRSFFLKKKSDQVVVTVFLPTLLFLCHNAPYALQTCCSGEAFI